MGLYQSRKKWGRIFDAGIRANRAQREFGGGACQAGTSRNELVFAVAHIASHTRWTRVSRSTSYIANRLHRVRGVWHQGAGWRAINKLVAFRHARSATGKQCNALRIIKRNIGATADHACGIRHEHRVHMTNGAAKSERGARLDQTTRRGRWAVCRLNAFLAKANQRCWGVNHQRINRFSVDRSIHFGIAATTACRHQHAGNKQ